MQRVISFSNKISFLFKRYSFNSFVRKYKIIKTHKQKIKIKKKDLKNIHNNHKKIDIFILCLSLSYFLLIMGEFLKKENSIFIIGIVIRVALVLYSEYQDLRFNIKYTDIDYRVYSDGADQVYNHGTPYDAHTYRYTPLLAIFMVPNLFWDGFGKTLFVITDILCAHYMRKILSLTTKLSANTIDNMTAFWVFNPVIISVSTRGNADTLISLMVLMTLYYLVKGNITKAALIFGFAVHFKIYPFIYALPMYFYIDDKKPKFMGIFTKDRVKFALLSASVFILFIGFFYLIYG